MLKVIQPTVNYIVLKESSILVTFQNIQDRKSKYNKC